MLTVAPSREVTKINQILLMSGVNLNSTAHCIVIVLLPVCAELNFLQ